jgi:succinylarginine dihydrolase
MHAAQKQVGSIYHNKGEMHRYIMMNSIQALSKVERDLKAKMREQISILKQQLKSEDERNNFIFNSQLKSIKDDLVE